MVSVVDFKTSVFLKDRGSQCEVPDLGVARNAGSVAPTNHGLWSSWAGSVSSCVVGIPRMPRGTGEPCAPRAGAPCAAGPRWAYRPPNQTRLDGRFTWLESWSVCHQQSWGAVVTVTGTGSIHHPRASPFTSGKTHGHGGWPRCDTWTLVLTSLDPPAQTHRVGTGSLSCAELRAVGEECWAPTTEFGAPSGHQENEAGQRALRQARHTFTLFRPEKKKACPGRSPGKEGHPPR